MDLSILIPVYNGEKFIKNSLTEILKEINSIDKNISYEVIIYDDGSNDQTYKILKSFENNKNLCIHHNTQNNGLAYARNFLVQEACGTYLLFIDSDDAFVPGNLSKCITKYLKQNNDFIVFSTLISYPDTNKTKEWKLPEATLSKDLYVRKFLRTEIPFFAWGKLIKKTLFENIFYPEGEIFEDTLTMLKIALKANEITTSEIPLIVYKKREKSLSEGNEINYCYLIKRAFEIDNIIKNSNLNFQNLLNELFYFKVSILTEGLTHVSKISYKEFKSIYKNKIHFPFNFITQFLKNKLLSKKKKKAFIHAIKINLNKILLSTKKSFSDDIFLFCLLKNEEQRIDYFYDYYQKLGVTHFFMILNNCTDTTKEKIEKYNNTTIFEINKNYNHHWKWVSKILRKYGTGHWCFVVDIDELFVYKDMNKCSLRNFIHNLEANNYNGVKSLLVDFYPEQIQENSIPFMNTYYFDKEYYEFVHSSEKHLLHKSKWYKGYSGGPRARVMGLDKINLTKYPLFYFSKNSYLYQGMHYLHGNNCQDFTTVIKHFKFDYFYEKRYSDLANNSNFDEIKKENTSYLNFYKNNETSFYSPEYSIKYENDNQLLRIITWHTFQK